MTTLYYLLLFKYVREKGYKTVEYIGDDEFIPELLDSQMEGNLEKQKEAAMVEREKQMQEEQRRREIEELKRFKESLNLPIASKKKIKKQKSTEE